MVGTCEIYIIDDDSLLSNSLKFLFSSLKLQARAFASGEEFLAAADHLTPGCVILDVHMPGQDGLRVQREMAEQGLEWPVIFMTGHTEVPEVVRAIKSGAVEFMIKPFREEQLLAALHEGFRQLKALDGCALRKPPAWQGARAEALH